MLKVLKNTNVAGKTVLYRAPYDIETKESEDGTRILKDESRIKCTLPTLKYLIDQNCKIVILTWVGRPENGYEDALSTKFHASKLSSLLNYPVRHIDNCIGEKIRSTISGLKPKEILMLENTRFHKEEYDDNDTFAKDLTSGSDIIVFDAFPQSHRKHASTTGILKHLPSCAGLYFEEEITSLSNILENPARPFTVVIGGAKTSDKIEAVNNLINKADIILMGGGSANAFLKAEGKNMGNSFVEAASVASNGEQKDIVQYARALLDKPSKANFNFQISIEAELHKIQLPYDLVLGKNPKDDSFTQLAVAYGQTNVVPENLGAYDIGPITCKMYSEIIMQSKTVLWAGPLGVYEKLNYAKGTKMIVDSMSNSDANTMVAGGDTIDAINSLGDISKIKHISLAGGATLDYIAGKEFPVLKYLVEQT